MRVLAFFAIVLLCSMSVYGHGRMIEPPARATAWRYGFPTPHNYDDNALFCGGFARKQSNGGKCGVCGDPWNGRRENEAGGLYATGTIVRNYTMGATITLKSDITANHYGWMEYRICPNNDVTKVVTQECLDKNLLQMADGSGSRYVLPTKNTGVFSIQVKLPANMVCSQCVVQWKYHAANSWGVDQDTGRACVGCGPQEEFYGCADVSIRSLSGVIPVTYRPTPDPTQALTQAPTQAPITPAPTQPSTSVPVTAAPNLPGGFVPLGNNGGQQRQTLQPLVCKAINQWAGDPSLDQWCTDSCSTGNCPILACNCSGEVATPSPTKATTTPVPTTTPTTTTPTTTTPTTTTPTTTTPTTTTPTTTTPTTTTPTTTTPTTTTPTTTPKPTTTTTKATTVVPVNHNLPCHGINLWFGNPSLDQWCTTSCAIGNCPADACSCDSSFAVPTTAKPTPAPTTPTPSTTTTPRPTTTSTTTTTTTTTTPKPTTTSTTTTTTPKPTTTPTTTTSTTTPTTTTSTTTQATTTTQSNTLTQIECIGINAWAGNDYLDRWCADSCARGNCPEDSCKCTKVVVQMPKATVYTDMPPPTTPSTAPPSSSNQKTCKAIGQFKGNSLFDVWCTTECNKGNCSPTVCLCEDVTGPNGSTSQVTSSTMNPLLATSYTHCVSNGRETGDYWNVWCQDNCDRGSCPIDYCNCS